MSSPRIEDIRSEILTTTVLFEGCLPTLTSTVTGTGGRVLQRHVNQPLIGGRSTLRSFCKNSDEGGEVLVTTPVETEEAIKTYIGEVVSMCERLQQENPTRHALPRWGDTPKMFRDYTNRAKDDQQYLLSEAMGHVYASRDSWPFTYHVYSDVKEFMDDGGVLLGPEDLPMEQIEYAHRLARAVKSVKGFDELVEVSSDNIKMAFTTEVVKPLRLVRPPPSYEDDEERSLEDWGVLEPEASVVCQVTDDSPEWIKRNRGAQDSYGRSILKAIGASFNPTSTIELELETTADIFVQHTKTYEHLLFRHAAYTTASQVSFMEDGGHTDESLLLEMEMNGVEADENDPIVDGHLVKAAWLDPSMFDALTGKPPRGQEYYTKRFLEYGDSIKEGLATMRREFEQGSGEVDGLVTTEAREWGTWTQ